MALGDAGLHADTGGATGNVVKATPDREVYGRHSETRLWKPGAGAAGSATTAWSRR